jgi:hypothetical protein
MQLFAAMLFISTAFAVALHDLPKLRFFFSVLSIILFIVTLLTWQANNGNPSFFSLDFLKAFAGLAVLTLFGAAAGTAGSTGIKK